ncbi:type II toxin-antitoxin system PemK/MazF family toxin [Scandinavium goeteborgense]|uniref:type II toxin-antitoxin system PemK/MazF family toxin n=1 Tax=Scandinavium goeteborgense TaxID=1851514 RepID=UPI00216531C8|nr:type II toxin-antitoxin system PemK/MazF family toxin [Scandinavium goeteborgense]MCS2152254.1 type II toxin-antitoxin system PemK/MazF family toxin [Scandinavium goeteborgense]
MAINFSPRVGQILTCNYGKYPEDGQGNVVPDVVDAHMPPEMVKFRLVVVLNGRLNGNSCTVVPISTTKDPGKLNHGFHVQLPHGVIKEAKYFPQKTSWAKCDMVQTVSNKRLNRPMDVGRGWLIQILPCDIVSEIQKAVIKAINASALLASPCTLKLSE